jgi:hypothetical protein
VGKKSPICESTIFWDVMICIPVEVHRCSEETIVSIFRVKDAISNDEDASNKLSAACGREESAFVFIVACLGYIRPENGGSKSLRYVDERLLVYTTQIVLIIE